MRLARLAPIATVDMPLTAYRVAAGPQRSDDVEAARDAHRMITDSYGRASAEDRGLARDVYIGDVYVRVGRRAAGARHFASMAWRHRRPHYLVWAATMLVAPAVARRRSAANALARVSPEWAEAAGAWLSPIRERAARQTTSA
jgi:hypothetical protein